MRIIEAIKDKIDSIKSKLWCKGVISSIKKREEIDSVILSRLGREHFGVTISEQNYYRLTPEVFYFWYNYIKTEDDENGIETHYYSSSVSNLIRYLAVGVKDAPDLLCNYGDEKPVPLNYKPLELKPDSAGIKLRRNMLLDAVFNINTAYYDEPSDKILLRLEEITYGLSLTLVISIDHIDRVFEPITINPLGVTTNEY